MTDEQRALLISWLGKRAGYNILSPAGATNLSLDIQTATGTALGVNTVKRLLGIIPSDHAPRTSTLDVVAAYIGAASWKELHGIMKNGVSEFDTPSSFVQISDLPVDKFFSLTWVPDRHIVLRHVGNGICEIKESQNSKLHPGDLLTLTQIAIGFPFLVKDVVRNNTSLGPYSAALQTGISSIKF